MDEKEKRMMELQQIGAYATKQTVDQQKVPLLDAEKQKHTVDATQDRAQ